MTQQRGSRDLAALLTRRRKYFRCYGDARRFQDGGVVKMAADKSITRRIDTKKRQTERETERQT